MHEGGTPAPHAHIPALDGVRGVAVSLVLVNHFLRDGGLTGVVAELVSIGWIGVDLFFVLSGALITSILLRTRELPHYFRNFYARRSLRIFPLYYAFLAVVFILFPLQQGGPYWSTPFMEEAGSPAWYVFYLTNVRAALPGMDAPRVLRILWSLAVEEHFYLLFPFAVWYCTRRQLVRLLLAVVAFAIAIRVFFLLRWPEEHELQYLLTPSRFDAIALGCLLTLTLQCRQRLPGAAWWAGAGALLLGCVGAIWRFSRVDPVFRAVGYTLVALGFALLLGSVLLNPSGAGTRWLRWPPLRYLGTVSYGVYVLHVFAEASAQAILGHWQLWPDSFVMQASLKFLATLALAAISWHWFEAPILALKQRFDSSPGPSPRSPDIPSPVASQGGGPAT